MSSFEPFDPFDLFPSPRGSFSEVFQAANSPPYLMTGSRTHELKIGFLQELKFLFLTVCKRGARDESAIEAIVATFRAFFSSFSRSKSELN